MEFIEHLLERADATTTNTQTTGTTTGTTGTGLPPAPKVTTTTKADSTTTGSASGTNTALPTLLTTSSSSSSSSSSSISYTTPSITVPANSNNPYIVRESQISGTVFIAVGAIVGAIILIFITFHLVKSIKASRLAQQGGSDRFFEKYHSLGKDGHGNGGHMTPVESTIFNQNTEYLPLVSKLPLLAHHPSRSIGGGINGPPVAPYNGGGGGGFSDNSSTIYNQSDAGTSKHDLTKLFISPTAEVMGHKRVKSSTVSLIGGSSINLSNPSPANNRYSQAIPNIYMNSESNYSESEVSNNIGSPQRRAEAGRQGKKTIPSMYLDDLIDQ